MNVSLESAPIQQQQQVTAIIQQKWKVWRKKLKFKFCCYETLMKSPIHLSIYVVTHESNRIQSFPAYLTHMHPPQPASLPASPLPTASEEVCFVTWGMPTPDTWSSTSDSSLPWSDSDSLRLHLLPADADVDARQSRSRLPCTVPLNNNKKTFNNVITI